MTATCETCRDLLEALEAQEELSRIGLLFCPDGMADRVRELRKAAIAKAREHHPITEREGA